MDVIFAGQYRKMTAELHTFFIGVPFGLGDADFSELSTSLLLLLAPKRGLSETEQNIPAIR